MVILLLTHFDAMKGPSIFKMYPSNNGNLFSEDILTTIASLMDLHIKNEIFQIYFASTNISTLNRIITIKSSWSRATHELIMFSLITKGFKNLTEKFRKYIEEFENSILKIPDVYKGFYQNNFARLRLNPEISDISEDIFDILKEIHSKIPDHDSGLI